MTAMMEGLLGFLASVAGYVGAMLWATRERQPKRESSWRVIFYESRLYGGSYNGDRLETNRWEWPRGTWLQEKLKKREHCGRKHG